MVWLSGQDVFLVVSTERETNLPICSVFQVSFCWAKDLSHMDTVVAREWLEKWNENLERIESHLKWALRSGCPAKAPQKQHKRRVCMKSRNNIKLGAGANGSLFLRSGLKCRKAPSATNKRIRFKPWSGLRYARPDQLNSRVRTWCPCSPSTTTQTVVLPPSDHLIGGQQTLRDNIDILYSKGNANGRASEAHLSRKWVANSVR